MTEIRPTDIEPGCYVDGWWGQYAGARLILIADEWCGMEEEDVALAVKHLDTMGRGDGEPLTEDEWEHYCEAVADAIDAIDAWLPDGLVVWAEDGYGIARYCGDDPDCIDDECACNAW